MYSTIEGMFSVSRQQQEEQERRDRELALRLAAEDESAVEDLSQLQKYAFDIFHTFIIMLKDLIRITVAFILVRIKHPLEMYK